MTLPQTFVGSFIEILSICCFINLFDDKYLSSKLKTIIISLLVAAITTATDMMFIPIGYVINYVGFIVLLTIILHMKFLKVFFEFLFGSAVLTIFQIFLVFITSIFTDADSMNIVIRMLHIIIMLAACIIIGNSTKLQLIVRPFYTKYNEIIYLVAGNLFLFIIIQIFLWDSNHKFFIEAISVTTAFIILWCCINGYLFKKLVENRKQNEIIKINENYIEMTENLLNGLYAEKHDFKKHLQAIVGIVHTEDPDLAVSNIENYIMSIENDSKQKFSNQISFQTGDSIINGLLYTKFNEAVSNDIGLFYIPAKVFPKFPCEKHELVEIIGNLIDNAFDYVKALDPEDRKVIVKIDLIENKKCIEVCNTFYRKENDDLVSMSKKGYTTKNGDRRGYGLYNVKQIVSKYNGLLNIFCQDEQLFVQILF